MPLVCRADMWCADICLSFKSVHCSAAAANLACIITFLLWKPDPEQLYVFFVLPALWGMADAAWQTQTNGKSRTMVLRKTNFSIEKGHLLFRTYGRF